MYIKLFIAIFFLFIACLPKQTIKERTTGSPAMGYKLKISGQRDGQDIGKTILEGIRFIRYQYNRALRDGYVGNASIVLKMAILPNGKVGEVLIDSISFNFPKLKEGVLKEISKWDFGNGAIPNDTTWIRLPLIMSQP